MTGRVDRERLGLIVHEVRSPTAALVAIAAAVSEDDVDEDAMRELVGLALAACQGIARVVDDAAVGSVRLADVDLCDIASQAAAGAALGGARIEAVVDSGPVVVRADPTRLRQALDNLVANAIAHSSTDVTEVRVSVSVRVTGRVARVSVTDNGVGIPVDHHAQIFDPGVRLDSEQPGSGLGLSIVRTIVESHGGTLNVESTPGIGSTFTIALPLLDEAKSGP